MSPARRFVAAALLVATGLAHAQGYPVKPVKLVVPFAAGTGSDLIARQLAPRFGELLGQAVVVDNRPGGGGMVAAEAVARSPADGYTLFLGTIAQFVIAPAINGDKLGFKPDSDFAAIGTVARSPMLLVTGTTDKSPKSVAELLARVKEGPASFSSTGSGGFGHLVGELFSNRAQAKAATHIPYRGSAQSLADVAAGEVLYALDSPAAAIALIRANKLRPLGVTGTERMPALKSVPTLDEAGLKDMHLYAWFGVFAPASTPADVLQKLRGSLATAVKEPGYRQRLATLEMEPFDSSAAAVTDSIRTDIAFWQKFIRESGVKVTE